MEMFKQYLVSLEDLKYGLGTITAKMSSNATTTNKLLSESEIDQKIAIADTRHLYKTNSQGSFATKAELTAATTFYDASGVATTPTKNDIAYVLSDESHSNKTAKYVIESISGTTITWGFVIAFTDLQLTESQLQAINSGITASKVTTYDNYVNQFLKLTGGTMSGKISFASGGIYKSTDDGFLNICGGHENMSGGRIDLYGKSFGDTNSGNVFLTATDGSNIRQVIVSPIAHPKYKYSGTLYDFYTSHNLQANPAGTATANLTKIRIGDIFYDLSFLPKSGGTITGTILGNVATGLARSVDNDVFFIAGGPNTSLSPYLKFYGINCGGDKEPFRGDVFLVANNGLQTKEFHIKGDGTIQFGNKDVITSTSNSGVKKVWKGTLAEYNAITTKEDGVEYHITDDNQLLFDCLPKAGGEMTGAITMGANAIKFGTNNKELKANGDFLQYDGKNIPRIVSTYVNASTDVNGNLNISSYRPAGTSFPVGFLQSGMGSETVRYCFMNGGYYMSFGNSGASWDAWANAPITGTIFWLVW